MYTQREELDALLENIESTLQEPNKIEYELEYSTLREYEQYSVLQAIQAPLDKYLTDSEVYDVRKRPEGSIA